MLPRRFWEKVQRGAPDQCWPWLATTCQGYGHFKVGSKIKKAHRLAYEEVHGPIPDNMIVMHTCDNRRCVNVSHLMLGTLGDNNRDRDRKGRQVAMRGEAHGMSKLRQEQAAEIAALRNETNRSIRKLADKFGVSANTVRDVMMGRTWKWLDS